MKEKKKKKRDDPIFPQEKVLRNIITISIIRCNHLVMMIQSVAILIGPGIFYVIEHDIRNACYVSSHAERVFGRQIWYGLRVLRDL